MNEVSNAVLLLPPHMGCPVPLERIDKQSIPESLSGVHGRNRERVRICQILANTDLDAIEEWLIESGRKSIQTFRSYRREAERFYAWLLITRNIPLSSFTRTEITLYDTFLRDPQPNEMWCATRNVKRDSALWRPFEKGLSDKSRKQAMVILTSLFTYLQDNAYLSGNPFRRWAKVTKADKKSDNVKRREKHLDYAAVTLIFSVLSEAAANCDVSTQAGYHAQSKFERWLFITRFLTNTGLRREELATAVVADIVCSTHAGTHETEWFMNVTGKGSYHRKIALPPTAVEVWQRYLKRHKHLATPLGDQCPILLSETGGWEKHLSGQAVYDNTKRALKFVSDAIQSTHPTIAQKLLKVSPHWYRSTFATLANQLGADTKDIQYQLGHSSIETTAIYTEAEEFNHARKMRVVAI